MKRKLYRSHNSYKSLKGGIFTIDFCIALIILIFLIYYSLLIINSITEKILEEKREIMKYKLFLISERIIKRDLAKTDGKITYSNRFEYKPVNFSKYMDLGINYIEINSSFFSMKEGINKCTDFYCIERLVIKNEVEKIKICIC